VGLTAASLSQFATRAAGARATLWAAVLTFGGTDYACAIDPGDLDRELQIGGFRPERELTVAVATATGFNPSNTDLGKAVTIKTTATAALQTLVFTIKGIRLHSDNPEIILTLGMKP
jgi:hypothetical protein